MLKRDKLCGAIVYYDGEWDYVYRKYSKNGKSKFSNLQQFCLNMLKKSIYWLTLKCYKTSIFARAVPLGIA